MRVFVDAGVYMDYLKGKGSLRVLKAFESLLQEGKFKLIFPNITKEEIYRGLPLDHKRYSKNEFVKLSMPDVPAGIEEGDRYKNAKALLDQYSENIEEVRKESLDAVDSLLTDHIEKLLDKSEPIKEGTQTLEAAQLRKMKNNPPGKSTDPLGDEIVWELLLEKCIDDQLVVIAHDGDWKHTEGEKTELHPFLQKEWEEKTKEKIKLFNSLAPFIEGLAPGKVTEEDVTAEERVSKINEPLLYYSPPNFGVASGIVNTVVSPISTPSVGTWQPITVQSSDLVQCYACNRIIPKIEYYGFTPQGFGCRYCMPEQ